MAVFYYASGMQYVFWVALGIIVVSYMSLWYGVARYTHRYDVVDSAWGLGFIVVAWVSLGLRANFGMAQIVSAALVSIWGLRLFGHIARRNWQRDRDDSRYQALRDKWSDAEKHKAYTNIFLLQGALLLFVSLPMVVLAFAPQEPTFATYIGWWVWVFGIAYEAIADNQLTSFLKRRPAGSHKIMDTGLWRYSRHPNYFGEIVTWWGAAIVACSLREWWGVIGALTITLLITRVSGIPPLEKRYTGNASYETYRKHTPALIPFLKKSAE